MIDVVSLAFHLRKFLVNVSAHVHDVILYKYVWRAFAIGNSRVGIIYSCKSVLVSSLIILCCNTLYILFVWWYYICHSNSNLYFPRHFAMFYSLSYPPYNNHSYMSTIIFHQNISYSYSEWIIKGENIILHWHLPTRWSQSWYSS